MKKWFFVSLMLLALSLNLSFAQSIKQVQLPGMRPIISEGKQTAWIFPVETDSSSVELKAFGNINLGVWVGAASPAGTKGNGYSDFRDYNILYAANHGCLLTMKTGFNGNIGWKAATQNSGALVINFTAQVFTLSDTIDALNLEQEDNGNPFWVGRSFAAGTKFIVLQVNDNDPSNNRGYFTIQGESLKGERWLIGDHDFGKLLPIRN